MKAPGIGILVVSLMGGSVLAQDKAPAGKPDKEAAGAPPSGAAPTPSPELDALYKSYEGSWKCETTYPAGALGPGAPEVKTTTTVKIKKDKDLNGFWYTGEYQAKKTKGFPGMRAGFALGYDAGSKTALFMGADSMGGNINAAGTGATADNLSFVGEGYMMGQKVKVRETMAKKGPKEVEHTTEIDMGKGFQPAGTDVCKK
jgi:hypothetical protein